MVCSLYIFMISLQKSKIPAPREKGRKENMIYAEWTLYGVFENGFFDTWENFIRATFSPDIEILAIKMHKIK